MNFSRLTLLSLCCVVSSSLLSHAAVPIERRPLSSSSQTTTEPTPAANSLPIAPLLEPSQPSMLWQLTEQVQLLQEEIRRLRGNNEDQEQRLDALEKELQARFIDFDQRLEQLQEQLRSKLANPENSTTDELEPATPRDSRTARIIPPPPISAATSTNQNTTITAVAPTSAAEQRAYMAAYAAHTAGGTQKAIVAMEQFMRDYPNSVYIPNAHYWLGEFALALTPANLRTAQAEFNVVMSTYPRSARAAAAVYRLASIAEIERRSSEATRLMKILLSDYAGTTEAKYAQEFLNKRSD